MSTLEDPFFFIMRVPPKTGIAVDAEIVLFYGLSVESGLFCLLLFFYRAMKKVARHCRRPNSKVIEELENTKEEATGVEEPCPICFMEFEKGEEMYRLKCRHLFHKDCLAKWLEQQLSCPMCRAEVL